MKLIDRLFHCREKKETVSCLGCIHLYLWNDGSAYCDKGFEKICISNGFRFKEECKSGKDR